MNKELAIRSQQYGFLAGIFFFGYFIFEIPSNLLRHKVGARYLDCADIIPSNPLAP
jgi:MFS transporter, ACS family, tartrate transporter